MSNDLAKLNRLRLNAGKPELKSLKASQDKLDAAVKTLEDAGHTDALPGANVEAKPETTDPEIAANLVEPEKAPSLEDKSEEHTSELQSIMRTSYAVFRLKKQKTATIPITSNLK